MLWKNLNGWANQSPKVAKRLGSVLVELTSIHQSGMRVKTANTTARAVTTVTVPLRSPYNRSGIMSFLALVLRSRRVRGFAAGLTVSVVVLTATLLSAYAQSGNQPR